MPLEYARIPLGDLSIGAILSAPIFDPDTPGTKLLGAGMEISQPFLDQLASRGIASVSLSKRDMAAIAAGVPQGKRRQVSDHQYPTSTKHTQHSRDIDAVIEAKDASWVSDLEVAARTERPAEQRTDRYEAGAVSAAAQNREKQIAYVDDLFVKLVQGEGVDTDPLTDVCRDSIRSILQDRDLFLCLGLNPYDSDYPSRHSLHVCTVAISIGVMLGLDDQSLIDLGNGCLIHDVGMLKLDQRLYKSKRRLDEYELTTLADHPILTLEALACPGVRLTRIARIVAYQIHERCNGSGYPRGLKEDQVHSLAKIAAVADTYVGLVSNRWHRKGLMPYFAIEKLLNAVSAGLFDAKAVRGLLHAISLFPIGSFVETDDGRTARVVRATGQTYTQPIIEMWDEKNQRFEPDLINLTEESSLKIVRATQRPSAN